MILFVATAQAALLSALAASPTLQETAGPTAEQKTAAVELFTNSCTACHQAPDARFASDRAWLTQVLDTA